MDAHQIFIVDDDDAIRDALGWLFRSRGHVARLWPSAEALIASGDLASCGCLVLDIRMDGMSGLELFGWLRANAHEMPVIFLTGHADVPMAVAALKQGAFDFVEKPFNDNELVDRALSALESHRAHASRRTAERELEDRLAHLTAREVEVMERILAGLMNKVIAADLGVTMRTVEVHRARIFEKMAVRSAVELAQLLATRKPAAD
ncbi:MAG: response regulator [Gammaproteobacteria bacterium]|jgi:two-component system, LuxR family, response regulator DctR|nr:response regulator [Gammaproteobacteria bacterium]MBU0772786.1 response regulator [Gammaproteobacteria bacterium]MBU0856837.1 response regulator [Gammaproteobacteria bacterium]MBU1847586.1 response regulator [Gammaproteobacteria bacterium]